MPTHGERISQLEKQVAILQEQNAAQSKKLDEVQADVDKRWNRHLETIQELLSDHQARTAEFRALQFTYADSEARDREQQKMADKNTQDIDKLRDTGVKRDLDVAVLGASWTGVSAGHQELYKDHQRLRDELHAKLEELENRLDRLEQQHDFVEAGQN
ncbi:hypothetical protein S7711_11169 [Stachybotrys chartarum IBT 7711]|uniref:Uncharacterized protein n=1 Tax=Stachybotrys chartarum (strain CBS 109288 / IBT 7711) TaxID=1280523 RepID=A0A084AN80_STACB|nr:hypothetical protein S7711_11169 [Stachybotrys chartarum IBT 7711]KFA46099.1 hypothetical protein S40293_11215 [Stachybotrys chartarum IBT 40293]KFA74346.1 hypothetical protein S40288_10841 [Stachybotrys chartarum IBT 40288]